MKSGFGKTWLAYALLVGLTCVTGLVPDAVAQTPQDACAADSLYLISPDRAGIDLRMQAVGRVGMVISWPDLNLAEVACHSLLGTEDLDFEVTAEGDFADQVDRVFAFTTPDSGAIGGNVLDKMMLNWNTTALSSGGRIGGRINLSNSGGVFHHDTDGDTWAQHNVGLPMSWARTNVVALDAGADDFLVAGFTRGTTINTEPAGLWTNSGSVWQEIRSDIFGTEERITKIVLSPTSNDVFAVGMANSGLRITRDGGTTFTEWTYDLAPDLATYPTVFRVTALDWVGSRIVLAIANMGAFYSDDGGLTFAQSDLLVSDDLDDPKRRWVCR